VAPAPLRLADGRELPVTLSGNVPVVDWSRSPRCAKCRASKRSASKCLLTATFHSTFANKDGVVVRQLLTDHPYVKGSHDVKWDGLPTPHYRTPANHCLPANIRGRPSRTRD